MNNSLKYMVGACLLLGLVYIVSQIFFLNYYDIYKIPFGRVDVDNYLDTIRTSDNSGVWHAAIIIIGQTAQRFIDMSLFFTVFIPFLVCIVLPFSFFILYLYLIKDAKTSFLALLFLMFATYTMQAFMISAYWAQLIATIFLVWFILFYEVYIDTKNRHFLVLGMISAILMMFSHLKFAGALVAYIFSRCVVSKKWASVVGLFLIFVVGISIYPGVLLSTYPVKMGVSYVIEKFVFPPFWFVAVLFIAMRYSKFKDIDKTLAIFVVLLFLMSSVSALWRPLISGLGIIVYFVALCFKELEKKTGRLLYAVTVMVTFLFIFIYFYYITLYALNSMLGEMIPGVFNETYRDMDPNPFLRMFSNGNVTVMKTTGFVSSLTGQVTEKDSVIYGS